MKLNLLSFDDMLRKLLTKQELEEHLHHIICNIEDEFKFQSLGVYLKEQNSENYRMKISRNISYTFTKDSIFSKGDPLIEELLKLQHLDVRPSGKYIFEKEYSHLLILPLHHHDDLLGFLFIDKSSEEFESEEITKIKLFASIISVIVQLYLQSDEIEQYSGIYESARVYSFNAFIEKSEAVFSLGKRYNRDITMAVLKIENFKNLIRTSGEHETKDFLNQILNVIKNDLRETDIIGKIHEDSFAVLMPETSLDNGFITISRVNSKIMKLPIMKVCQIKWGIACKKRKTKKAVDLLKLAELTVNDANRKEEENIIINK